MSKASDIREKTKRVRTIAKSVTIPRQLEEALIALADIADTIADETEERNKHRSPRVLPTYSVDD